MTTPVRCPTCGFRVRRWRDQKRCPSCKQTKPAQEFGHARSRNDHLESQCSSCKRYRQRASYSKDKFGASRPQSIDKPANIEQLAYVAGFLVENAATALGDSVLRLRDVVLRDREKGTDDVFDEYEVVCHRAPDLRFRFKRGDRVVLSLSDGLLHKVMHLPPASSPKAVWKRAYTSPDELGFPDLRLSMLELLPRWFPDWTQPDGVDPWTQEDVSVECPLGTYANGEVRVNWEGLSCSYHLPVEFLGAVGLLTRWLGFKDEAAAVAECNLIEDEQLIAFAAELSTKELTTA
jgi:hypothetical protein